jgi:ABC-type spermidine/putrescine transport system permease subunit II
MALRRVTLPLIAPGAGSGAFLAFMASFHDIPVSPFIADERNEVLYIFGNRSARISMCAPQLPPASS